MTTHKNPAELQGIRNITISGRISTGKTTLANHLADTLGWDMLDGGKVFRHLAKEMGFHISEKQKVPDKFDIAFEEEIKLILINEKNHVLQSHLAGFVAQGIKGIYKILVICEDSKGDDKQSIRIDRIMNRDLVSAEHARREIQEREEADLKKYRRLYTENNPNWVYWDKKYYDLVVNTYSLNQKEALDFVLKHIGFKK
nr:cytidylate kinase family protein [Candidatus Levybacteria bacterium]